MRNKILILIGIIFGNAGFIFASNYDWSLAMTGDSKTVTVSSTVASPTQICTKDSYVQRTFIVNTSTFTIFISTVSNNLSTTTSFGIPGTGASTNAPVIWSPDGTNAPWNGALWAVVNTQSPPTISIFRSK